MLGLTMPHNWRWNFKIKMSTFPLLVIMLALPFCYFSGFTKRKFYEMKTQDGGTEVAEAKAGKDMLVVLAANPQVELSKLASNGFLPT